jgi:hypothetical protein
MLAEAPELRDALVRLTEWADLMGGWEARAWTDAKTLLAEIEG